MHSWCLHLGAVIATAVAVLSCGGQKSSEPLVVLAAASLAVPLDSIISGFETETGITVHVAYGASGTLAQQIRSGVEADLYLSADVAWIERLGSDGENYVSSWRPILSNRLVVVTATGHDAQLSRLEDLSDTKLGRIAIADPDLAPAGWYARAALERSGLYEQIRGRLVPTENVSAAAAAVRFGIVDFGIVYATDARAYSDLRVVLTIPESLHPPIRYGVAVLTRAEDCEAAERFLAYLNRPATTAIFETAGFVVLSDDSPTGEVP